MNWICQPVESDTVQTIPQTHFAILTAFDSACWIVHSCACSRIWNHCYEDLSTCASCQSWESVAQDQTEIDWLGTSTRQGILPRIAGQMLGIKCTSQLLMSSIRLLYDIPRQGSESIHWSDSLFSMLTLAYAPDEYYPWWCLSLAIAIDICWTQHCRKKCFIDGEGPL